MLVAGNKQDKCSTHTQTYTHCPIYVSSLTQYAGVGEPPCITVRGIGWMAVGLTSVLCTWRKEEKKTLLNTHIPDKTHQNNKDNTKRQSWDIAKSCKMLSCLVFASFCLALAHNSPTVSATCKPLIWDAGGWLRVKIPQRSGACMQLASTPSCSNTRPLASFSLCPLKPPTTTTTTLFILHFLISGTPLSFFSLFLNIPISNW